jgi:NADH-quinone oxidoreductase subunit L
MAWLILIPLLPALAFAIMLPMSRKARTAVQWLPAVATGCSLLLSLLAFKQVWPGGEVDPVARLSTVLARVGGTPISVGVQLDAVSAIMLLVVTIVGMCVQVYSLGYMHRDERRGWYFAVLSLFTAAMLLLVLADDFLLLYMSWEVMGLCSYLLIGFWHEQEAPRLASIKAFLTTRVGDVGFAIGLAIMWAHAHSFDFAVVLHGYSWTAPVATAVSLGLLLGAMGKSAQVPLHVWLPDAMAGPTPASALIHAATMVAAGVYLVDRALPIFMAAAPWVLVLVMGIGAVTALLGALLALVQYDIKKILAYSTISQLGYMFIALGVGSQVATLFHLMTHAFFKSLLFLGAGVIIHATHTQDIREMGGLRKAMPWTTTAFLFGALALSGVFPFSGFWSKDEILMSLYTDGHWYSLVALAVALIVAGLTALYMTRLCVRVFGDNACSLAHEGHLEMLAPMGVLAALSAVVGFSSPVFAGFLSEVRGWPDLGMAAAGTFMALSGIGAGWWIWGAKKVDTAAFITRHPHLYGAFTNKFYFDLTYDRIVRAGYVALSGQLASFDIAVLDGAVNGAARLWSSASDLLWRADVGIIDRAVNAVGAGVRQAGARVRKLQTGQVQGYQRLAYAALLALLAIAVLSPVVGVIGAVVISSVALFVAGLVVLRGA